MAEALEQSLLKKVQDGLREPRAEEQDEHVLAFGQVEEALDERVPLVDSEPIDEYSALDEHVDQIEHGWYDVKVGRLE